MAEIDDQLEQSGLKPKKVALPPSLAIASPQIASMNPPANLPGVLAPRSQPESATPSIPATIPSPQLEHDRQEQVRLNRGSGLDQFQQRHHIIGGLLRGLDVAGSILAPRAASLIPGTTMHHDYLVGRNNENIENDIQNSKRQAETGLEQAQAKHIENPEPTEETFKVVPGMVSPDGRVLQEGSKGTLRWSEGVTGAGPLKEPVAKTPNEKEQDIADYLEANKLPNNAANREKARNEIAKRVPSAKISVTPPNTEKATARSDKSYEHNSGAIDKIGEPISQAVQRMGRLKDTLAQATPQADALVAPELLTVMAGGAGSGLRMNEAEISRIVGGRSKWETLKASAQQWSLDPSKANSITPEQRQQIHALVEHVNQKLLAKQHLLDAAHEQLLDTDDPKEHRRIVAEIRKKITEIDEGQQEQTQGNSANGHKKPQGDPMEIR